MTQLYEIRPGWRTSEAIGGTGLSAAIASFVHNSTSVPVLIAGIAGITAIACTYIASRTTIKRGHRS